MRKHILTAVVIGLTLAWVPSAMAVFTGTINTAGGSGTSTTVNPAVSTSFSIDVNVNVSPETIMSAELRLTVESPGIIEIVSSTYGPDWDTSTTYGALTIPVGSVATTSEPFGSMVISDPPALTGNSKLVTLNLNVLPGAAPGDYAINLTDFMVGDATTFQDIGGQAGADFTLTILPPAPPAVTNAVSRKTHSTAGDFDFDVDLLTPIGSGTVGVECRQGGATLVVVTFDGDIQGVGGLDTTDVVVTSTGINPGTVSNVSISNSELTIEMSGASDAARLDIAFPGIASAASESNVVTDTICFAALHGDVTGEESNNIFDLIATRNSLNASLSSSNFRADVTVDGNINIFDLIAIRNKLNLTTGGVCPLGVVFRTTPDPGE